MCIPFQGDLSCGLAVFLTDLGENGECEDSVLTLSKRTPSPQCDAVGLHRFKRIFLSKERMKLYLIYSRDMTICLGITKLMSYVKRLIYAIFKSTFICDLVYLLHHCTAVAI